MLRRETGSAVRLIERRCWTIQNSMPAASIVSGTGWSIRRAEEGLQTHQEALAMFEALQDSQGMAETIDLLGMANGIYGDMVNAVEQYKRAIALFRSLSDHQGLISSLTTRAAYACPGWV